MGKIVGKIVDSVVGEAAGKIVGTAGDVVNNLINKKANEEKAKQESAKLEHEFKIKEIEAKNYKDFEFDYQLAMTSINYLIEVINKTEKKRSFKANRIVNNEIVSLIKAYKIPTDRDEFLLAAETISQMMQSVDEEEESESDSVRRAWMNKYNHFVEYAKRNFKNDKEICKYFGLNRRRNALIISLSISGMVIVGAATAITIGIINENKIPDPLPGQTIYLDIDSGYFEGKDYREAETYFVQKGFENVTTVPLGDLITGWVNKEYSVKNVTIDGESFSKKTWFYGTEAVMISYHSFK